MNRQELNSLLFACDDKGNKLYFKIEEGPESLRLTLPLEFFRHAQKVFLLPELARAVVGEEGFYLLPRNISMNGDILTRFTPREDVSYSHNRPIMCCYGVKTPRVCAHIRIDRNYKFNFLTTVEQGTYTVSPYVDLAAKDAPYDDLRLELFLLPEEAGYPQMAMLERRLGLERGDIIPLTEKCKAPAVEYARRYPLIRIRMGWKPSPSPVLHQTPDNEPDMFVACTFARVRDIADELKRQGVEGAELQLVGWNVSGHDGRFPQLFPVDERLGGEEELRATIRYVKSLGYRISLHTNLIDAYEIADTFTWDDVVVMRNGEYQQTGHYSGGYAYHVCLHKQLKNNRRDLPRVADLGLDGIHFTDVISIVEPDDCHSDTHPCNTAEGIRVAQQIMTETRELMGAFSSEGCFDFAMKYIDYGLYVSFGDGFGHKVVPICDTVLPFFELVYHGTVLYNPTSPTVNFPIKSPRDRLTFFMRGGRPSFYFYSKFRTGGQKNWMGEVDMLADTDRLLSQAVEHITHAMKIYTPLACRQLIYMTNYQVADSGIEVATYEDGVRMVGNFSDTPQDFEGRTIPPFEFVLM